MLVEERGDPVHVGEDPGHVARRGERAEEEGPSGVTLQFLAEMRGRDPAVGVLRDDDDIGQRLAPRKLVRMVLVWADEDDGPLRRRDRVAEAVAVGEVRREADLEDVDEAVDRRGRTGADEDDRVVAGRPDGAPDDLAGLGPEARGLEPGPRRFGVGVGVEREDRVAQVVLDERERASRRRVVGVGDAPDPERPRDRLVVPDDRGADRLDEGLPSTCEA